MADFGWPLPPAGTVDKKKHDELINMAKKQWTIFLGITTQSQTDRDDEWAVLNITSGNIVYRGKRKRIIEESRIPIIRSAGGDCVMRHVYDEDFLDEAQNQDDVVLSFPDMRLPTVLECRKNSGIVVEKIPGGHVLCTVLGDKYENTDGRVTVWSPRYGVIGCVSIMALITDRVIVPEYFGPNKMLIISPVTLCPEIWKIGTRLEFDSWPIGDISNIHACTEKYGKTYHLSKDKHLVLDCCGALRVVKFGQHETSNLLPNHSFLGWVGSSHFVTENLLKSDNRFVKYVHKLINIETGKERILPGHTQAFPDNSGRFACLSDGTVQVWCSVNSDAPTHVLKYPPGFEMTGKIIDFNISTDGLHVVTRDYYDVLRVWRKDKLIKSCTSFSAHRRKDAIAFVKILDPELDWVSALGQWLIYSLSSMHLGIVAIVLIYLV